MSARDDMHRDWQAAFDTNTPLVEYLLAAGYRKPQTITTREEVEALPDGAVLLDSAGDVAHLRDGFWFSYETSPMTHHRMAKYTPATVLYTPEES